MTSIFRSAWLVQVCAFVFTRPTSTLKGSSDKGFSKNLDCDGSFDSANVKKRKEETLSLLSSVQSQPLCKDASLRLPRDLRPTVCGEAACCLKKAGWMELVLQPLHQTSPKTLSSLSVLPGCSVYGTIHLTEEQFHLFCQAFLSNCHKMHFCPKANSLNLQNRCYLMASSA